MAVDLSCGGALSSDVEGSQDATMSAERRERRESLSSLDGVEMEDVRDENEDDDFDLYDDVVTRFEQKKEADQRSYEEALQELSINKTEKSALEAQVKSLKEQNAALMQQNIALKKNISCLFKTAKIEVKRKDDELTRLRVRYETVMRQKAEGQAQTVAPCKQTTAPNNQTIDKKNFGLQNNTGLNERLPREGLDCWRDTLPRGHEPARLRVDERTRSNSVPSHHRQRHSSLQR